MPLLFEYHNEVEIDNPKMLKVYLHQVWNDQYTVLLNQEDNSAEEVLNSGRNYQPFLNFDGNSIRANNYVGFIQLNGLHLEIYPKVFKHYAAKPVLMIKHLFFWFDYCRKWKFPFTKSRLDSLDDFDLPELIIYLMSSKMLETVLSLPISLYQPVEESLYTPKGKINFKRYLSSGFINGNQQILECDYEPFVFDNRLNRVMKYVCRLLLSRTRFTENQNILNELIFILDEVTDQPCSYQDLETVVLNPIFEDYAAVKDICKTILQHLIYANQQYDLSQWSLLFPMEYIFEDFIAGFIESNFSNDWKVEYQKSNLNLSSEPAAFQMQHDIFLTYRKDANKKIIIDTKYKLRDANFKKDNKKGISQTDMYQMTSYAFRRGCSNVLILYPNLGENINSTDTFKIESGFSNAEILITAAEVPFWSLVNFENISNELHVILSELLKKYE
ncbi:MAG: restriction endonuclease [Crocinitomicaceae bacterium]